jgi:hypothetical protein
MNSIVVSAIADEAQSAMTAAADAHCERAANPDSAGRRYGHNARILNDYIAMSENASSRLWRRTERFVSLRS